MPETGNNLASESLGWSLEMMAFVSPMPWESGDAPAAGDEAYMASIAFSGARHGVLEIAAPAAFARMLAVNLLSFDAGEVGDERIRDVFRELTNITCGTFIRRLSVDPGEVPNMSIPRVEALKLPVGWTDFIESDGCTLLEAEGYPIAVRLRDAA